MLTICKISEQERPSLRAMAEAYWQEIFPRSPVVHDPAYRARYFESRFPRQSGDACQYWAKVGEEIVGFANVQLTKDDAGDMVGCIKDFYISPDRRRQGHGTALAELLFLWLHGEGARRGRFTGRDWQRDDLQIRYGEHFSPFINERIRQLRAGLR